MNKYKGLGINTREVDRFTCESLFATMTNVNFDQKRFTKYIQKAIAVLLTLLYLGIKDIRLGPTIPAFLSANVLQLLSEKYNLQPITTPDADLAACLG